MKPLLLLLAFALSAVGQTNFVATAIITIAVTTNWQDVATVHPVNGGYASKIRRGYLMTNVTASVEWKGNMHELGLESRTGPSIGEFMFTPINLALPDGSIQGGSPLTVPPNMPPPLPR